MANQHHIQRPDERAKHEPGRRLTTAQGARLADTDHSLKAGERGPTLLQDHHLREKITHFDHERIPERVVHARGAAAHGVFESYGTAAKLTQARFLAKGARTDVFTRFSTVVGSRGSLDTARDTRGFATKFYTDEGVFDLVGNNIPVFFIQDGIKFPDVIHAVKPEPDREIPQAQSAHDTFWDFVSLHTEAQAHTMWNMSDRGIPRSYRMMEGFGIHTFRLVAADGSTTLVKFHWKPSLGVHSLTWEEAQLLGGFDPDFHRRDLADAIAAGHFPSWELGVQVFPDTPEQTFQGIDLLDPTKFVPEELAPVQPVGRLTLNENPTNYFAETEQVAFHPGHLVPGIDVTDDPLLQARLFSYLDTQITRLGGPNFSQIPINQPHAPVDDNLRDGLHQHMVHGGTAPYLPNSIDGGCPFAAGAFAANDAVAGPASTDGNDHDAFVDVPQHLPESWKLRTNPASFEDHFSQATLFYRSLTPIEQRHTADAYAFELSKVSRPEIQQRQVLRLASIDTRLATAVAEQLGVETPEPEQAPTDPTPSPALAQVGGEWPINARRIAIIVDSPLDPAIDGITAAINDAGATPVVVAPTGGKLADGSPVPETYATARSVQFDGVVLLGGDERVAPFAAEAFRHAKAILASSTSQRLLRTAGIADDAPGVLLGDPVARVQEFLTLLRSHRVWERFAVTLLP